MDDFKTYIILDNIRSAQNVGSIFRTADALGVTKIFLVGITPAPIDRFGREQSKVQKAALGAEKTVAWEQHEDIETLIHTLQESGVSVVACEQSDASMDYKAFSLHKDTAFIFGREVEGVDSKILKLCDHVIEIPMRGKKESLNVAVAVGIALSRIVNV